MVSTRTSLYLAPQVGHWNGVARVTGMSTLFCRKCWERARHVNTGNCSPNARIHGHQLASTISNKNDFGQILDANAHYKVFEPSEEWGNRKNLIQFSGTKTGEIMYV